MGRITDALKKVSDERLARIQHQPEFQYIVKKAENTAIEEHIVAFHDPSSPVGEQYKILRTHMQSLKTKNSDKIFLITSSINGEGKTVTATNLAITMSHDLNGKKVLLIDADMRKGKVAKYLGVKSHAGLSEILQDKASIEDAVTDVGIENLNIIFSGKGPKNPSELLNSKNMERLIASLKPGFDYIFIDTPPVIPLTDACILGPMTDGVILVIQAGRTQRDLVKQAQKRLQQAHAKITGYVMTNIEYHLPAYLHRYVQKYDTYGYHQSKEKRGAHVT